jgi:tetratricopeptide (TPR) repeat protein
VKESESTFDDLLRDNPEFAAAYANLGYLRMLAGMPAEALRLYKKGLLLDPDNIQLLLNTAAYYLYGRQNAKAAEFAGRVLKLRPGHPQALQLMAQLSGKR